SVYPEHKWMKWRFKTIPHGYWKSLATNSNATAQMIGWLGEQLSIKRLIDFYRVSLQELGKWVPVRSGKELGNMLEVAYPQHQWNTKLFGKEGGHPKASQRHLKNAIQQLFPTHGTSHAVFFFRHFQQDSKSPL